jgi:hypothetical protein
MKYTTCINLHHIWQGYRIFWQLNDVTWDSFPAWTPLRRIMGSSEIHEKSLAKNTRCTHDHLRGTSLLTGWDRGLPEFQTLVCPIKRSSQPNIFVSWTFSDCWTINPVTLCWLRMSIATDFPGGKPTNENYNTFGNDGHTTIYRNLNSDNAGWGHSLIYNYEMFYWGRITRLLSSGQWLSSTISTQDQMASFE